MKSLAFIKLIFLLLSIIAITMLLPTGVAFFYGESSVYSAFLIPILSCLVLGGIFLFFGRKVKAIFSIKFGFLAVAILWISASILGAMPFFLSGYIPSFTDAFFESVSGFTTTGATILSDVEHLPRSLNLWRAQMHWLGGMGIVALTVALMPILGVGGFQLIKAETTGPEKGKITPKITVTAKILWFIYLAFTIIQTILLVIAGMDFIDALSHTFSTLGTGGFSTRNSSLAYYNSPLIDWICIVFMFLAGINFSLYFRVLTGNIKDLFSNTELKAYFIIVFVSIFLVSIAIFPQYQNLAQTLRYAAFQVISIISTTGFANANYLEWIPGAQVVLFLLMFIGGCSGSTAGGIKVVRWVVLQKQAANEIKKMLHPHGVFTIQLNDRAGRKDVVYSVAAFFFIYFLMLTISTIITTFSGVDILTSFIASLSMLGNIGPGFGRVGPVDNYSFFSPFVKWWYCFTMLAGRLELYTMLIFFTPSFWKK